MVAGRPDLILHLAAVVFWASGSHPVHDAYDANGDVQIEMTIGDRAAMYGPCKRPVVLRVVSPEEAKIVFDGAGDLAWSSAGKPRRTGSAS